MALSLLGFAMILRFRVVGVVGLYLRYDMIFLPLVTAGFFVAISKLSRDAAAKAIALLSVVMCAAVLSGMWEKQISDLATLAGIYPHKDGRNYFNGCLDLLYAHQGAQLMPFASRRPLSVVFWAFLHGLGGMNIRVTMALMVFIGALALAALSREAMLRHGWVGGWAMFLVVFFFYRRFIGAFLSEHLGLSLGALAFVLFYQTLQSGRKSFFYAGLFALSMALNVRAGAMFILPALALWAGWEWRGKRWFALKPSLLAMAAVAAGFGVNHVALHAVGHPEASQGNFSYVLYGLVHDGDWTQVHEDHPDIGTLPDLERHRVIYALALDRIIERPSSLAVGALRALKQFFIPTRGIYSFVLFANQYSILRYPQAPGAMAAGGYAEMARAVLRTPYKYLNMAATFAFCHALILSAILWVVMAPKDQASERGFLGFAFAGILASVPFAPPWDADLMRVYAATIPFLVAPAVNGLARLNAFNTGKAIPRKPDHEMQLHGKVPLVLTLGIALLFAVFPVALAWRGSRAWDPAGHEGWSIRLVRGSVIKVAPAMGEGSAQQEAALSALHANSGILHAVDTHRAQGLHRMPAGVNLALGYERSGNMLKFLVIDDEALPVMCRAWVEAHAVPFHEDGRTTWWRIKQVREH